ncbi:hypothetical protein ACFPK9_04895 [Rubritalea spongiae]|uniref:Uncharacterized protein n=1 Tax=Rubritalea spongiae TaxID=430797 RepID=A0ABW5E8E7_9BACT
MILSAMRYLCALLLVLILPLQAAPPAALVVEDFNKVPQSFELYGTYQVHSIIRVRSAKSRSIPLRNTIYRVYSNGQELRLYQEGLGSVFHSYEIYRADGISEQDDKGNIAIKPGLQARLITEDLVKQIAVTQQKLTITQFPPLSDTVVITYAKRAR